MAIFTDKFGRDIEIEVNGDCAEAFHNGRKIGDVITTGLREVDERYSMPALITGWDVDFAYRRAGIATELVKALVEDLGVLAPAKHNEGIGGLNALTDEGEAITEHCQKLGLIDLPLVFHPATTGARWSFTPVGAG